ncbi:hypothetical protein ABVK25_012426, partial [Lepraria finkii]
MPLQSPILEIDGDHANRSNIQRRNRNWSGTVTTTALALNFMRVESKTASKFQPVIPAGRATYCQIT